MYRRRKNLYMTRLAENFNWPLDSALLGGSIVCRAEKLASKLTENWPKTTTNTSPSGLSLYDSSLPVFQ